MTALTATPGPAGTVTLTATGMPVFGALFDGPTRNEVNFAAENASTTVGSVMTADDGLVVSGQFFNTGGATVGHVTRQRVAGVAIGNNFVLEVMVSNVNGQRPVQVWLDHEGTVTERLALPTPDGESDWHRLRLYFQAEAAEWICRIKFQPLYPYDTASYIMWKDWTVWRNDAGTRPFHDTITVHRTDANGTNVAVPVPQNTANTTGTLTVTDREAALTGPLTYWLTDTAYTQVSASTELDTSGTWLSSNTEGVSLPVALVTGYGADRQNTGTVHRPVRRTYPVVVRGPLSSREGTLDLFAPDRAAAVDLLDLLRTGAVAVLRQPDFDDLDVRFVPRRVSEQPAHVGADVWSVSVDYVEVS